MRMERAASRRFPSALVNAHYSAIGAGRIHALTLAWMLDVPPAELEAELDPKSVSSDLDWLELEIGARDE